jgi:hypothetical protein
MLLNRKWQESGFKNVTGHEIKRHFPLIFTCNFSIITRISVFVLLWIWKATEWTALVKNSWNKIPQIFSRENRCHSVTSEERGLNAANQATAVPELSIDAADVFAERLRFARNSPDPNRVLQRRGLATHHPELQDL